MTRTEREVVNRKLGAIASEVKELHPLLHTLLPRLPNVENCEYTHGPDEKGADFILTVKNPTFQDHEYIGVIAKRGKITQAMQDIERQIDECRSLPRLVNNGRDRIYLSSIWVVATGSISTNAKEKIYENHSGTSIKFIDRTILSTLILQHAPFVVDDIPTPISIYLNQLNSWITERIAENSILEPTEHIPFLHLDIVEIKDDEKLHRQTSANLMQLMRTPNKFLIIEGEMGSGKTRQLQHLIQSYTQRGSYTTYKTIPIVTSAKELIDDFQCNLEEAILAQIGDAHSPAINDGAVFAVVIDGFDEISLDVQEISETLSTIEQNLRSTKSVSVVVASRFLPPSAKPRSGYAISLHIRPLSTSKLVTFIRDICPPTANPERLLEDLRRSDLFRQLPQNPMAAVLLSRLIREDPKDLPAGLTEIYSKVTELMLGRWDMKKGLLKQREYTVLDSVVGDLAIYMLDNQLIEVGEEELRGKFKTYIDERNFDLDANSICRNALERTGVLAVDKQRRTVRFKHRSFAEFMYARKWDVREESTVENRAFAYRWQTCCFFYIGLRGDCPALLSRILSTTPDTEVSQWMKLIASPSYLMAGSSSPYRVVEEYLPQLMIEAARLFVDITRGKTSLPITNLSEFQILYLFQLLVRQHYGYRHFEHAVDTAALFIDDEIPGNDLARNVQFYAMLFLGLFGKDIGQYEPIRFLIEKYKFADLPPALIYALNAESKVDSSDKNAPLSQLFKKHNKRLKRMTRRNPSFLSYVNKMFKTPIKDTSKGAKQGSDGNSRNDNVSSEK